MSTQDVHIRPSAEPAISPLPSCFGVCVGPSVQEQGVFTHLAAYREPLAVQPASVTGQRSHILEVPTSALVSAVGWAAKPVPIAELKPRGFVLPSLTRAGGQHEIPARKSPDKVPRSRGIFQKNIPFI